MVAGESIGVILDELFKPVVRMAWTDSQSGMTILTAEGGSWRTRHLRMRSSYARQVILDGLWTLHHVPGEKMIADLGTKALAAPRVETVKKQLNMGLPLRDTEVKNEKGEDESEWNEQGKVKKEAKEVKGQNEEKANVIIKLITIAATLASAKAQGEHEDDEEEILGWEVMMILIPLALIVLPLVWCLKEGVARSRDQSPSDQESAVRSPPRTPSRREARLRAIRKKESEEDEEEVSRPSHLPSPMRSPGSAPPHTPTQLPVTQVTMWGFPSPNGRWLQPERSPSSPTGCRLDSLSEIRRKKKKEEAEKTRKEEEEEERKEEERGSTGAASSAMSASADAQSRFQQRGESSAHAKAHVRPPPMQQGESQDPKILTTKFGRVHHRRCALT